MNNREAIKIILMLENVIKSQAKNQLKVLNSIKNSLIENENEVIDIKEVNNKLSSAGNVSSKKLLEEKRKLQQALKKEKQKLLLMKKKKMKSNNNDINEQINENVNTNTDSSPKKSGTIDLNNYNKTGIATISFGGVDIPVDMNGFEK